MIDSGLDFILLIFATFRLTRLFVYDKITGFIRSPFHHEYDVTLEDGTIETFLEVKGNGVRKFIGELLSCYWCTGVWCAFIIYCGYLVIPIYSTPVIIILALAGCASIVEAVLLKMLD